jgi:hypothetical protein
MTDASIAAIARRLAEALARAAYERDTESKKAVAQLQTELCETVRRELAENTEHTPS